MSSLSQNKMLPPKWSPFFPLPFQAWQGVICPSSISPSPPSIFSFFFLFFLFFQKMDFSKPFEASDLLARLLAGNEFPENPASSQGNGLLKPSDETIRPICELAKAYFTKENNVLDISAGGDNPIFVRKEAPGCCSYPPYFSILYYSILFYSILCCGSNGCPFFLVF